MSLNDYIILGLDRDANESAIRSAYRKLALKHHPDKNPGPRAAEAAKLFIEVKDAQDRLLALVEHRKNVSAQFKNSWSTQSSAGFGADPCGGNPWAGFYGFKQSTTDNPWKYGTGGYWKWEEEACKRREYEAMRARREQQQAKLDEELARLKEELERQQQEAKKWTRGPHMAPGFGRPSSKAPSSRGPSMASGSNRHDPQAQTSQSPKRSKFSSPWDNFGQSNNSEINAKEEQARAEQQRQLKRKEEERCRKRQEEVQARVKEERLRKQHEADLQRKQQADAEAAANRREEEAARVRKEKEEADAEQRRVHQTWTRFESLCAELALFLESNYVGIDDGEEMIRDEGMFWSQHRGELDFLESRRYHLGVQEYKVVLARSKLQEFDENQRVLAERLAREKREEEEAARVRAKQIEAERLEAERLKRLRIAKEQRLAREAARIEAERLEAIRLAEEKRLAEEAAQEAARIAAQEEIRKQGILAANKRMEARLAQREQQKRSAVASSMREILRRRQRVEHERVEPTEHKPLFQPSGIPKRPVQADTSSPIVPETPHRVKKQSNLTPEKQAFMERMSPFKPSGLSKHTLDTELPSETNPSTSNSPPPQPTHQAKKKKSNLPPEKADFLDRMNREFEAFMYWNRVPSGETFTYAPPPSWGPEAGNKKYLGGYYRKAKDPVYWQGMAHQETTGSGVGVDAQGDVVMGGC